MRRLQADRVLEAVLTLLPALRDRASLQAVAAQVQAQLSPTVGNSQA